MPDAIRNMAAQKLGEIKFDGARHTTSNLSGDQFAYAEINIPSPLPADWVGKVSRVAAYASADGDPSAFKWMSVGPNIGEWGSPIMNPACVQGQSTQIIISFGQKRANAVTVNGGEKLYINVQNREPAMAPGQTTTKSSCGAGKQCDFSMDASIPGAVSG